MKRKASALMLISALLFLNAELVEMAEADPFASVYAPAEPVPDTIPPSMSIYSPQNNTIHSSNDVDVSLCVSNAKLAGWNSSIIRVAYFLDGEGEYALHTSSYYDKKGDVPELTIDFNLSSLSSGKHNLTITALVFVVRDKPAQFFSLDCSSTIFFTTSSPAPTPTPFEEPQQVEQEVILGVTITATVLAAGLSLLVYLIKRK